VGTLRSRDELTALHGLLTAAMADCDAPGADAADRQERQRLFRYRVAVRDALRGTLAESADPDTQAMADWLVGEGPNPLTPLGHSLDWRTSLHEEELEDFPDGGEGLTIRAITAGELPGYLDHLLGEDAHTAAPASPAPQSGPPVGKDWMDEVLGLARPVAGRAPERYVAPHPVVPTRPRSAPVHASRTHAAPGRDRIWLDVPYCDKDIAKQRGAIWDPVRGSWYAPRPGMSTLAPWLQLPEVIAGEDRTLGQGLFVDLIPRTSWFTNVRSAVSERDWFRIRKMVYRRAMYRCEACGATEDKAAEQSLECHERFSYRARLGEASGLQALRRLICLCSACHRVTHFGHTSLAGDQTEQAVMAHLIAVTGMNTRQAREHVEAAFRLWASRSEREWVVNLSLITDAGIGTRQAGKEDAAWAS
jgi:hypothetical protein